MTNDKYYESVKRNNVNNRITVMIIQLAKENGVDITFEDVRTLNISGDVSVIELLLPLINMRKKELLYWLDPEPI